MKFFLITLMLMFTSVSNVWQPAEAQLMSSPLISITSAEAYKMIHQDKAILVDVRERNEVDKGLALPAYWMPLSKMENDDLMYIDFINRLPKNKIIIIYCASGKRAKKAQQKLENLGYHTENSGGFSDWINAKLPTRPFDKK